MSDAYRVFHAVHSALRQLYPKCLQGRLAQQMTTLAFLICGIVRSQSCQLPAIARKIPSTAKVDSRVKRFSRWLDNEHIEAEVHFLPFIEPLLAGLAARHCLVLFIDGSDTGRNCASLMLSVRYKRRAIPLAWITIQGNKGHFSEALHVRLMEAIHPFIPEGSDVLCLGDGEFDGIHLQQTVNNFGWQYVFRTAKNIRLSKEGDEFCFSDLDVQRGERISVFDIGFTKQAYGPLLAIAWWETDYQEPIFLVTNMELIEEACYWYRKRFLIETFFSDKKSRGFNLHKSHLSDPQKVARLLIASCLAYIWMVYLGATAIQKGWNTFIHRNDRCDLSLFQLGLRLLDHFLNEAVDIPCSFNLPAQKSVRW